MDPARCKRLWQEHGERLVLLATTILSDSSSAEDAVQAVFARLLSGETPREASSEVTYLYRAVRNEALDRMRSRRRVARLTKPLFVGTSGDPREAAEFEELRRQVESALLRLPPDQREAVVLKIWADLSFPEGAEVLGISGKAFEHRFYRGMAALEGILGKPE